MFAMKVILFLLVACLTQIYASPGDLQIFRACLQENDIDKDVLQQYNNMEEVVNHVTPHKFGCVAACYLKKQLVDPIPIKKHITDRLNESHLPPGITDDEIATCKTQANRCIEEAKEDDCKLMECLKPWSSQTKIGKIIGTP